jgi:hypothetical protein
LLPEIAIALCCAVPKIFLDFPDFESANAIRTVAKFTNHTPVEKARNLTN